MTEKIKDTSICFTVYLSFKNKETAEKWLRKHDIDTDFTDTQIISVNVRGKENGETKNTSD